MVVVGAGEIDGVGLFDIGLKRNDREAYSAEWAGGKVFPMRKVSNRYPHVI
jgi:hypothetical protein